MATAVNEVHAFELSKKAGREPFKVKDLSLAEFGHNEIRLAEHEMPGLMALRARYAGKQPLAVMAGYCRIDDLPRRTGIDGCKREALGACASWR